MECILLLYSQKKDDTSRILTIPNLMSFTRLISCPLLYSFITGPHLAYALPCIFLFSLITFFTSVLFCQFVRFHRWLGCSKVQSARISLSLSILIQSQSFLGTILDPLADKVMMLTMAISLGINHMINPWIAGIIVDILFVNKKKNSLSLIFLFTKRCCYDYWILAFEI